MANQCFLHGTKSSRKLWDTMELTQNNKPELVDIVTYLDRMGGWCGETLFLLWYVSTSIKSKYWDGKACEEWKKLKIDIGRAAISEKSPVICNGGYTCQTGEVAKVFKCMSCHCTKWESTKSVSSKSTLYIAALVNNCSNGHGKQGLKDPKRIKTTMKDIICKFSFTIKVADLGFYVHLKNQCGHPIHPDHPRPYESDTIPIPSGLHREEEIEDMASAANAVCSNSMDRNFMEGKLKIFINSMHCNYKRKCSKDDFSVMLADFQWSKENKFTTLSNISITYQQMKIPLSTTKSLINLSLFPNSKNEFGIITNHPTSEDPNLTGLQEIATNERHDRKMDTKQVLFIKLYRQQSLFCSYSCYVWRLFGVM